MVGTIVLAFLCCWFPFAVWFALSPFSPDIKQFFSNHDLVDLVTWLGKAVVEEIDPLQLCSGYAHSFLNPMIYAIMNPTIRTAMRIQIGNVCSWQ